VKALHLVGLAIGLGACAVSFPDYPIGAGGAGSTTSASTVTSAGGACFPNNAACVQDGDCCGHVCADDGHCGAPVCADVGGSCASSIDCCQVPNAEACITPPGAASICLDCCTASAQCTSGCCVPVPPAPDNACTGACYVATATTPCLP